MTSPLHHPADPPAESMHPDQSSKSSNPILAVLDFMQSYGDSLMKEINKLREQVMMSERQENEVKRLNQKLETANKELYNARKDAAAAQQIADARWQQTVTRQRQKERDEALAEAKKMRRAREEVDTERAKTKSLRGAVRELEQEREALRTERSSLLSERDELKAKLDASQKLIEEYTNLLQAATKQQDAARPSEEQHAVTQRSLKDAQQTCVKLQHKLTRQKTSYDTQIAQLHSELDAANAELRQAERFRQKLDTLPKRKEMLKLAVLIQQRKDLLRKRVCFNCGTREGGSPSSPSNASVEDSRELARQALASSNYYHASPFGELSSDDTSTSSFVPGDDKSPESDAGYCAGFGAREPDAIPEEPNIIWEPSPSLACIGSTSMTSACASMPNSSRKRKSEEPWPDN